MDQTKSSFVPPSDRPEDFKVRLNIPLLRSKKGVIDRILQPGKQVHVLSDSAFFPTGLLRLR